MMKTILKKLWRCFRSDWPVYSYYSIRLQKYLACQMVKTRVLDGKTLSGLVLLDWLGDAPITPQEFRKAKAGKICFYPQPIPRTFVHVFDSPKHRYPMRFYIWDIPIGWWPAFADQLEKRKLFSHLPYEEYSNRLQLEKQTGILDLRGKKSIVDISDSVLDEIIIDANIQHISFYNSTSRAITDPDHGLRLNYLNLSSGKDFPRGMENLTSLGISADYVDLQTVAAAFPNLRHLSIEGDGGTLTGLSYLKDLSNLEYFICRDMYAYDGCDMPKPEEMPRLSYIWLDGFPAATEKHIEKYWKQTAGVTRWYEKARSQKWIERNCDNPFRCWHYEHDPENVSDTSITKAGDIYKKAKARILALSKLPQEERSDGYRRTIKEFITAFNDLHQQYSFDSEDDTDEIFEVLQSLAQLAPTEYDPAALREIFDSEKNF